MDRFLFIINPKSGFKINSLIERQIKKKAFELNKKYIIEYTKQKGDGFRIATNYINQGFNKVICVGGDGTLREILEAVFGKRGVVLGIIPAGSGNGAARNLSIPLDIEKALDLVFKPKKIIEVDCGVCNSRLFINVFGVGFDAYIANLFNRNQIRGIIPYFIHGISAYLKYKPITVEVDFGDGFYRFTPFVLAIANGRQYGGGAIISPNSSLFDGFLDLVVIDNASTTYFLRRIKTLFNGKILENEIVKTFVSKNFRLRLPPQTLYHLDGEDFISETGVISVSLIPKAFSFIVNDEIL